MSPHLSSTRPSPHKPRPPKRARLPSNTIVTKRPLSHPSIPPPRSSARQTIYLRYHTPFIPTIKRIRTLLSHISARHTQSLLTLQKGRDRAQLTAAAAEKAAAEHARRTRLGGVWDDSEVVCVKASGRAIEKALNIAGFLISNGEGVRVRIRTGTVGAIDDLEAGEAEQGEDGEEGQEKNRDEEEEELPEARIRHISFVEVLVTSGY